MEKIKELRQLIKDFTKRVPTDTGELDFSYREYLAKCSKLLEQDIRLSNIERSGNIDSELEILISEIKKKIEKIIN